MKRNIFLGTGMLCKEQASGNGEAAGLPAVEGKEAEATDEGTVRERIDKGLKLTEEAAKLAAENIKKQNKDRRVAEMQTLLQRSAYTTDKVLNRVRKSRDIAKVDKAFLTTIGKLDLEVKDGKHDKVSYEKAYKEAYDARDKGYKEADKSYSEYNQKLKQLYVDSWSYNWDYEL